jgi:hypothetical protein
LADYVQYAFGCFGLRRPSAGARDAHRTNGVELFDGERFLDTHLRLDNEYAFHALALDEHREDFDATFWTKTVKTGEAGAPDPPIAHVEQRCSVGCHANVGGGYASDPLSQRPFVWLMEKAAALGLVFREQVVVDETQTAPSINDPYREIRKRVLPLLLRAVLSLRGRRAPDRICSYDGAHQRDDRCLGVRSLAHQRAVSPG